MCFGARKRGIYDFHLQSSNRKIGGVYFSYAFPSPMVRQILCLIHVTDEQQSLVVPSQGLHRGAVRVGRTESAGDPRAVHTG